MFVTNQTQKRTKMMPLKRNIMVLRNPVHPIFLFTALRLKDTSKVVIKIYPIYD